MGALQASASADDPTNSPTDVVADSMSITPGAGDYHEKQDKDSINRPISPLRR